MNQPSKFIIYSTQRSGTSWLVDLLDNHPETYCFGEMFLKRPTLPKRFYHYQQDNAGVRPFSTNTYLRKFEEKTDSFKAAGFNLMYNHSCRYPEVLIRATIKQYKIIHLVRRSHFDKIISAKLRQKSDIAHITDKNTKEPEDTITLDPEEIKRDLKKRKIEYVLHRNLLRLLPTPKHTVCYNDMTDNFSETMTDIADFLDISDGPWNTKFSKVNKRSKEEVVENYDEIKGVVDSVNGK